MLRIYLAISQKSFSRISLKFKKAKAALEEIRFGVNA